MYSIQSLGVNCRRRGEGEGTTKLAKSGQKVLSCSPCFGNYICGPHLVQPCPASPSASSSKYPPILASLRPSLAASVPRPPPLWTALKHH